MMLCPKCSSEINGNDWFCEGCKWRPLYEEGFPVLAPQLASGCEDYPLDAHDSLVEIESENFWFIHRIKLLLYLLGCHVPRAERFLEIGCGTGFVLSAISNKYPDMKLFGIEAYPSGLKHAKKRTPFAEFAQMDAGRLPFFSEFDVVGAFDVLEHIEDDEQVLRQIHKALKPGGCAMITVPQHPWLWSGIDRVSGHKRRYSRNVLGEKVTSCGFIVEQMTSFVSLLLPFMYASRRLSDHKKANTSSGLRLHSVLNAVFSQVCTLERKIIQNGIPLPVGGSLVCVASKL